MRIPRFIFWALACVLFSMVAIHATAQSEITEIELETALVFTDEEGEPIEVPAGKYSLSSVGENLRLVSASKKQMAIIPGEIGSHDEKMKEPAAIHVVEQNNHYIALLFPDGETLEATGLPEGISTRGLTMSRTRRQSLSTAYQSRLRTQTIPQGNIQPSNTGTLDNSQVNLIVSNAFANASFRAHACDGSWKNRFTVMNIPNGMYQKDGLSRLHYNLPDSERDLSGNEYVRYTKIRACVNNWQSSKWRADINNGMVRVLIPFHGQEWVTTKTIKQLKSGPLSIGWSDSWGWSDSRADSTINDYVITGNPFIYVYLNLLADGNGGVTYSVNQTAWSIPRKLWIPDPDEVRFWYGPLNKVPALRQMIIDYSNDRIEDIRQRFLAAFNNPSVRNMLSFALTSNITGGGRSQVAQVSNSGGNIVVTYR